MEIVLGAMVIAKIFLFLFASVVLAVVCLFPINDKPTRKVQWAVWIVLESVLFVLVFGFASIKFVV